MEQQIFEALQKAQAGSREALALLLCRLEPMLRFAARCLRYEDAEQDLAVELIAAVKRMDLSALRCTADPALLCYFRTLVHNLIPALAKRRAAPRCVCFCALGGAALEALERAGAAPGFDPDLTRWELGRILTGKERRVIELFFFEDLSMAEIAARLCISRQAANGLKLRGLAKLRRAWGGGAAA